MVRTSSTIITFFSATGLVLGGTYSLWLFNRIAYGTIKIQYIHQYSDLTWQEFVLLLPLVIGTLIMGIYPEIFLSYLHTPVSNILTYVNDVPMSINM